MIVAIHITLWLLKFWGHIGTIGTPAEGVSTIISQVEESFFTPDVAFADGVRVDAAGAKGSGVFHLDTQGNVKGEAYSKQITGVRDGAPLFGQEAEKVFRGSFPGQIVPVSLRLFQTKGLTCAWSAADTAPSMLFIKSHSTSIIRLPHSPNAVQISRRWICAMAGPSETLVFDRGNESVRRIPNVNWIGLNADEDPIFSRFSGKTYRDPGARTTVINFQQVPNATLNGWVAVAEFDTANRWQGMKFERSHLGQPFLVDEANHIRTLEKNAIRISSRRWLMDWGTQRTRVW